MLGVVFWHSPCYYKVVNYDDTSDMWICMNLNTRLHHYFTKETIEAGM